MVEILSLSDLMVYKMGLLNSMTWLEVRDP